MDTTQSTFQRWIDLVSTLWIAVEMTLIEVENKTISKVGFSTLHNFDSTSVSNTKTAVKKVCKTSMQPFFNIAQRRFNVASTFI